jgi:preprotein translocase subunit YajC
MNTKSEGSALFSSAPSLQVRSVANGYVIEASVGSSFCRSDSGTHVFPDAESLGRWVAAHFKGGESTSAADIGLVTGHKHVYEAVLPEHAKEKSIEEQLKAIKVGDVVVLNTGERNTITEIDGTRTPIRTNRKPKVDETQWFWADGRLRCSDEDSVHSPRIVRVIPAHTEPEQSEEWLEGWPKTRADLGHMNLTDVPNIGAAGSEWRQVTRGRIKVGDVVAWGDGSRAWASGLIGDEIEGCSPSVYRHPRYEALNK